MCNELMTGEWQPPESSNVTAPPADNVVLGYVIQRLFGIARPPTVSITSSDVTRTVPFETETKTFPGKMHN